jgi:hypothetical protein
VLTVPAAAFEYRTPSRSGEKRATIDVRSSLSTILQVVVPGQSGVLQRAKLRPVAESGFAVRVTFVPRG